MWDFEVTEDLSLSIYYPRYILGIQRKECLRLGWYHSTEVTPESVVTEQYSGISFRGHRENILMDD